MGQYYILVNATRGESSDHLGKSGEFNVDELIKKLGWSKDDAIYATGDYGDVIIYTTSAAHYLLNEYGDDLPTDSHFIATLIVEEEEKEKEILEAVGRLIC